MKKNAKKKSKKEVLSRYGQRTLFLAEVIRENLYGFVIGEGMKALDTMLEQERERICGPAYGRREADAAKRCDRPSATTA